MNREELLTWIPHIKEHLDSRGLDTYAAVASAAADVLRKDGKTIETLSAHLDCILDFVCESNAMKLVGAPGAVRDAHKYLASLKAGK